MNAKRVKYIPIWKCNSCEPGISLLMVVSQPTRSPGIQSSVTLYGASNAELAKALRIHPDYESLGMNELLAIVRKEANARGELTIQLSSVVFHNGRRRGEGM